VKQQLFTNKDKENSIQTKVDVPIAKKASTIKKIFERASSLNENENQTNSRTMKKKIIQVKNIIKAF